MGKVEKISPEQAIELLKKAGRTISRQDAELILDLLYKLANIAVQNLLLKIHNEDSIEHN